MWTPIEELENPFVCDWYDAINKEICGYSSKRQWDLERHIERMHLRKEDTIRKELQETLSNPQAIKNAEDSNEDIVVIRHPHPQSTVHALLLPLSGRSQLSAVEAFQDPDFLALIRKEAQKWKNLVGNELQIRYGRFSKQGKAREDVLRYVSPLGSLANIQLIKWTVALILIVTNCPKVANGRRT